MSTATLSPSSPFLSAVLQMFSGWFSTRSAITARPLTRFEEAEQMRAMADDVLSSDPEYAQDLYTAADRHELA